MPVTAVRLLDHDPDLGERLTPAAFEAARRELVAAQIVVHEGRWDPATIPEPGGPNLGLLVLGGLLLRDLDLGRRSSTEVVGAGDVLRPWDADADIDALPVGARWSVLQEARMAVLDEAFLDRVVRYPPVVDAIFRRAVRRQRWLSLRLVVNQLVRLEDRLLVSLWALADRWGRVTTQGVLVPMPLTHSALARLVGARRPSVTTAVGTLSRDGILERTTEGWLLRGDPAHLLDPVAERVLSGT